MLLGYMCSINRFCSTVLQSSCTNLYSYQQHMRVLIVPYLCRIFSLIDLGHSAECVVWSLTVI